MDSSDTYDLDYVSNPGYQDFLEKLLANTPESWDGEESAEWIAVEYVHEMERRVIALGGSLERWPEDE